MEVFCHLACDCSSTGSSSAPCDKSTGKCTCLINFRGAKCDQCVPGYYGYPACLSCRCDPVGSIGTSCRASDGQCSCKAQFQGRQCNKCQPGFYGFPNCQRCQCNPAGTKSGPGGIDCSSTSNVSLGFFHCAIIAIIKCLKHLTASILLLTFFNLISIEISAVLLSS